MSLTFISSCVAKNSYCIFANWRTVSEGRCRNALRGFPFPLSLVERKIDKVNVDPRLHTVWSGTDTGTGTGSGVQTDPGARGRGAGHRFRQARSHIPGHSTLYGLLSSLPCMPLPRTGPVSSTLALCSVSPHTPAPSHLASASLHRLNYYPPF